MYIQNIKFDTTGMEFVVQKFSYLTTKYYVLYTYTT